MAKLTAPLLSMGARGSIGKSMVVGAWRGVKYARQHVIPANPRTTAQQNNRTRFALLREAYKLAPAAVQNAWIAFCKGRPFLPFNKFVGENNRLLNGQTDFANLLFSPGAGGGLPPAAVNVTTGANAGEVDVEIIAPAQLPTGWTIDSYVAAGVNDQNPIGIFEGTFVANTDAGPNPTITLGGFTPGGDVMAAGFIVYEKPNGDLAYSVSVGEIVAADA
jgi:hypothetical protein